MGDDETVTLAKQGGITFIGRIIDLGLGFLFLAVVTRIIDPTVYGEFTLALSVILLLQRFDMNLERAVDYFLPEQLNNEKYGKAKSTLYYVLILSISIVSIVITLTYFAAPLIADLFNTQGVADTLQSLVFILPLLSLSKIFYKYFNVIKKTQYRIYIQNIIQPATKIITLVVFVFLGLEALSLTLSYFFSYLAAFLMCLVFFVPRSQRLRSASKSPVSQIKIIRYTFPLLFAGVVWTVVGQLDYFIIGYFATTDDVAHYRVGYQLAANLVIVSNIFNPIFKPMIAERQSEPSKLQSIYRLATRWISMMVLPLCIVFILAPEPYLTIFFTKEYAVAGLAVTILALGYLFSSSVGPEGLVLTGLGYSKLTLLNSILMIGVNAALDLALVPHLGITGAAVGTAVAFTVRSIAGVVEIYVLKSIHPYSLVYTRIWIAGAVAVVAGVIALSFEISQNIIFVGLPVIVTLAYIGGLVTVSAFTDDDKLIASRLDNKIGYSVFHRIISFR